MTCMTSLLSSGLDPRTVQFTSAPRQMYVDGQWTDNVGYSMRNLDHAGTRWIVLGAGHGWQIDSEGGRFGTPGVTVSRATHEVRASRIVDEPIFAGTPHAVGDPRPF